MSTVTGYTVDNRADAMAAVADIVSRQVFTRLGFDCATEVDIERPTSDVRLIQRVAPVFVDVLLDEVLRALPHGSCAH